MNKSAFRNKKVMVVVAHPDDEILGLGAFLNQLNEEYNVLSHVVILGEGITSRSDTRNVEQWEAELAIHKANISRAQSLIKYTTLSIHDFPDNRFDTVALLDIIKVVEKEKQAFSPDIIFTHHGGDVNIDHQRTFEAVITACRPLKNEVVKTIICFETFSGTEWRASNDPRHFIPNLFFSVNDQNLAAKIQAMESYEFEKREFPHPRSPEAIQNRAKMWGVTCGVEYAEAFYLVRSID
jgi:LmbE family N-acetylglucosaminyl deacetylase